VQLDITKSTDVPATQERAWALVSDMPKLCACIPGLDGLTDLEPNRYSATITDKLGPFRLQLPVQLAVVSRDEPRRLAAQVSGNDGRGQARVKGSVEALLEPAGDGTRLTVTASIDVLGKLAALGATPMRRRADDIFNEFVRRVEQALQNLDLRPVV
jgi:carbon monoxide dehydrogenase subunit G